MKKYIINLCSCDENKVSKMDLEMEEEFKIELDEIFECSLDELDFEKKDINKKFWILDDGGDMIVLKDGRIINVCFRYGMCRIWEEDDEELISYIKEIIKNIK